MPPVDSEHPEHAERTAPERDPADQPLDAVVYDVHPALAPQPAYPYGPGGDLDQKANGENPFRILPHEFYRPPPIFSFPMAQPARFKVPERFGMSAILGIMTALAVLFGGLKLLDADPLVYLFFGVQGLLICVVQMFHGRSPRFASSVAGAVILPVFVMCAALFSRHGPPAGAVACMMTMGVPIGGFLGYLTGTCAAGIFLIMDALEPYMQGQRPAAASRGGH
jgi:hypothetical protein